MSNTTSGGGPESLNGQRGYVALLFADVCDYTALAEHVDPEDGCRLKGQLETHALAIITKHGGDVVQLYGDGIFAVFGFPAAREDSARRAVDAALDLHEYTRKAQWDYGLPQLFELRIHTGVHVGLVFGRPGNELHGRYDLTGDAVNITARLCAAARRDEILVSSEAMRGIEGFFASDAAVEIALKGKTQMTSVHRILGRTSVRTRFEASSRRGLTSFVGRESELEQLMGVLHSTSLSIARLAIVTGPAGVGKTRLLEELRAIQLEAGVGVLFGSCDNYTELAPLEPFIQVLRQLLGLKVSISRADALLLVERRLADFAVGMRVHLQTILELLSLAPRATEPKDEHAVATALTHLFETVSAELPLVIILDDWQWADDASRALLAAILENPVKAGSLCIVIGARSFQPSEHAERPRHVVNLAPFSESESQRVVEHLLPRHVGVEVASALYQRSGGNALFLEELCRSLPIAPRPGTLLEPSSVPATLQGVIHARVARLPMEQADLLRVASVVGIEFSSTLLAQLTGNRHAGNTWLEASLHALGREDLIYAAGDPGTFRFKHGIAREVIYDSVRLAERRRLHGVAARIIEQSIADNSAPDESETLAYHYGSSGDHERAAEYSEIAGDKALQQSSLDRARFHYAVALAALEKLAQTMPRKQQWLKISDKWALPCAYSPTRDHLRVMERAAVLAAEVGDLAFQAQTRHWLGWFHFVLGDYAECISSYRQALDLATSANNHRLVAQLWSGLGQAYGAAGEYNDALPLLSRGMQLKKSRGQSSSISRAIGYAHASACKALVHSDRGEFDLADEHFREALEIVRGTWHPMEASILSQQCIALLRRGEWLHCQEASERTIRVAERASIPFSIAIATFFLSFSRWMRERSSEQLSKMREASAWLELSGQGLYSSFVYSCMAEAYVASGEIAEATVFAQRALQRVQTRDLLGEAAAYRVLTRVHWLQRYELPSHATEALAMAFKAGEVRESCRELALTKLLVAELDLESGDSASALAGAREAQAEFARMGMEWHMQLAQRVASPGSVSLTEDA